MHRLLRRAPGLAAAASTSAYRLLRGRASRLAAAVTASAAAGIVLQQAAIATCESDQPRFQDLPPEYESQRFVPAAPYPAWDSNWDYCELTVKEVAHALKHEYPVLDYADAIRKLYAEHTDRSADRVEKLIRNTPADELPSLYKRAYLDHAYGGAVTRHIILVRHGQYDEQSGLARTLSRPDGVRDRDFGMPTDDKYPQLDAAQQLTPLGRRQAEATGRRIAELLKGPLSASGREAHVRLHVSTLQRAKETADIIAEALPAERVRRLPPDASLAEGYPPAHRIPYGRGAISAGARDVHVEGARIEAAYRSLFYRGKPPYPPPPPTSGTAPADSQAAPVPTAVGAAGTPAAGRTDASKGVRVPRHEYDVVVCHGNVIRYFALRALQLPPEAWLRLCTYNCSLTHIKVRPSGSVSLISLGDTGHLRLEESSFSMHEGYEW